MRLLLFVFCFFAVFRVQATTFPLPANPKDSLVGDLPHKIKYAIARYEDTLLDIARQYDLGQNQILLANPDVDRWLPGEGTKVRIPNSYILPDAPRDGLILNLPEFRLYYFPKSTKGEPGIVITHPISIGRQDWETPLGKTWIQSKKRNPVWIPPASIKKEHAEKGDPLPDVVPAGPDNPLGLYAMRLAIPGYLIHSTNKPFGVGMRVSHGCVRMYPEDIENLFPMIKVGTPVYIVNQPIKVGWLDDTLYIEVHPPLEDDLENYQTKLDHALDLIEKANGGVLPVIRGAALKKALQEANGIPVAIFERPVKLVDEDTFD
jgi:L,D-transpeptidase ErfK/SrfK